MPDADHDTRPHVVIIGAGFGGLTAARALRSAPVRLTVIDRTNHHLFQPLLYQVATAGLSPADIAAPIRSVLRKQSNTEVLLADVTGVESSHVLLLDGRKIPYHYLIIATGSRDNYFGHPEWENFAPGLKSIADATAIRRRILLAFELAESEPDAEKRKALMTFVLVGAGPTGVEMAGAIAELAHVALAEDFRRIDPRSARIVLIEGAPRILLTFPEDLAAAAHRELEKHGVEVRVDSKVEQIDATGVFAGGERIHSSTVIWTAGVQASPAAEWLSAESDRAGRVIVTPGLTIPNRPNIYVIGDTAAVQAQHLPGVAPVAMQQARYAAWSIICNVNGYPEPGPFKYHDKGNLATVGRSFAILHRSALKMHGFAAWVAWLLVHIYFLIGFRNRLAVMFDWAWAYITFQRGARLIPPAPRTLDRQ